MRNVGCAPADVEFFDVLSCSQSTSAAKYALKFCRRFPVSRAFAKLFSCGYVFRGSAPFAKSAHTAFHVSGNRLSCEPIISKAMEPEMWPESAATLDCGLPVLRRCFSTAWADSRARSLRGFGGILEQSGASFKSCWQRPDKLFELRMRHMTTDTQAKRSPGSRPNPATHPAP